MMKALLRMVQRHNCRIRIDKMTVVNNTMGEPARTEDLGVRVQVASPEGDRLAEVTVLDPDAFSEEDVELMLEAMAAWQERRRIKKAAGLCSSP